MKSRWVMLASAVFMAGLGLVGTFLPDELLAQLKAPDDRVLTLGIQLTGALYFAFAILNWMAKDSLIGGIYNRPATMGNLVHFIVGGLSLAKGAISGGLPVVVLVATGIYVVFAIAFGILAFTSPVKPQS